MRVFTKEEIGSAHCIACCEAVKREMNEACYRDSLLNAFIAQRVVKMGYNTIKQLLFAKYNLFVYEFILLNNFYVLFWEGKSFE